MPLAAGEEKNRRRRRFKPTGLVFLAIVFSYFFEIFFVTRKTYSLFDYAAIMLKVDEPSPCVFRQRPISLQILDDGISHITRTPRDFRLVNRTNLYWEDNNDPDKKEYYHPDRRPKDCEAIADWHDELHPSCLSFHEIAFSELSFSAPGNKRDTWMYEEYDGSKRALKMLRALNDKHFQEYDYVNTERHRMDAIAAEQLSSSPYIASIYGHCSNSAVYDYAGGGHLWTIFNHPRRDGPAVPPTKDELFKYAHDAAMGLADTHHVRIYINKCILI